MKKKIRIFSKFLLFNCITFFLKAEISPHTITFFIRPLPQTISESEKANKEKIEQKFSSPKKIAKAIVKKEFNSINFYSGVYVSYAGYIATSDLNGEVSFPRKNMSNTIHILVTEEIKAVAINPLKNKTILGFVLKPKATYSYYKLERKQDTKSHKYSWQVSQEILEEGKKIPYDAIIIFADSKDIVILNGEFATIDSENLVLPDIYATPDISSTLNAFRFLNIRHFFAPLKVAYNFKKDSYQKRIIN